MALLVAGRFNTPRARIGCSPRGCTLSEYSFDGIVTAAHANCAGVLETPPLAGTSTLEDPARPSRSVSGIDEGSGLDRCRIRLVR